MSSGNRWGPLGLPLSQPSFSNELTPRMRGSVVDFIPPPFFSSVYMKIFSWNIRGINNSGRQRMVRSWLQNLGTSVGALLETHVQEENFHSVFGAVAPGWRFENNYAEAAGGRIWLLWKASLSVVVYRKTDQLILCGVLDPETGLEYTVAVVYAHNTEVERRSLWRDMRDIARHQLVASSPFVILGDFNQILSSTEHFSIQPYDLPVRGMEEFRVCLEESNLSDMDIRGTFFSWSNKRPEDPILRKLDRALCNERWRERYPEAVSIFEAPGDSDHSPIVVHFSTDSQSRKCSFKYFSFMSSHPRYIAEL